MFIGSDMAKNENQRRPRLRHFGGKNEETYQDGTNRFNPASTSQIRIKQNGLQGLYNQFPSAPTIGGNNEANGDYWMHDGNLGSFHTSNYQPAGTYSNQGFTTIENFDIIERSSYANNTNRVHPNGLDKLWEGEDQEEYCIDHYFQPLEGEENEYVNEQNGLLSQGANQKVQFKPGTQITSSTSLSNKTNLYSPYGHSDGGIPPNAFNVNSNILNDYHQAREQPGIPKDQKMYSMQGEDQLYYQGQIFSYNTIKQDTRDHNISHDHNVYSNREDYKQDSQYNYSSHKHHIYKDHPSNKGKQDLQDDIADNYSSVQSKKGSKKNKKNNNHSESNLQENNFEDYDSLYNRDNEYSKTDDKYIDRDEACKGWNKQQGSRHLQQLLSSKQKDTVNYIINFFTPQFVELSLNIFGNYVAQKIVEVATKPQLKKIAGEIYKSMGKLCFNNFGCRVVLKFYGIMAICDDTKIEGFANRFIESNCLKMILDQNANYIVQKVINLQPSNKIGFIVDIFLNDTVRLTENPYSCRVLQKLILKVDKSTRDKIFSKLEDRLLKLCFCQFGNYLIQHLAEKGSDSYKEKLQKVIVPNVLRMGLDKFASNVVEKALMYWNLDFHEEVFEELKQANKDYMELPNLIVLIQNEYGNYVAQRIFKFADESVKRQFMKVLNSVDRKIILQNNYSKHVYTAVSNYFYNARKEVNGNQLE